jgi:hypothetical protein
VDTVIKPFRFRHKKERVFLASWAITSISLIHPSTLLRVEFRRTEWGGLVISTLVSTILNLNFGTESDWSFHAFQVNAGTAPEV